MGKVAFNGHNKWEKLHLPMGKVAFRPMKHRPQGGCEALIAFKRIAFNIYSLKNKKKTQEFLKTNRFFCPNLTKRKLHVVSVNFQSSGDSFFCL